MNGQAHNQNDEASPTPMHSVQETPDLDKLDNLGLLTLIRRELQARRRVAILTAMTAPIDKKPI